MEVRDFRCYVKAEKKEKEAVFIDFSVQQEEGRIILGKLGAGKAFQAIKMDEHSIKNSEQL